MKTATDGSRGNVGRFLSGLFLRSGAPGGMPEAPEDQPEDGASAGTTLWNGQMLLPGIAEPYEWDFGGDT